MQSCRLQPLESTAARLSPGDFVFYYLLVALTPRRVKLLWRVRPLSGFCASQPWSQNKNPPFKNEASAQRQDRHRRRARRLLGKKRKREIGRASCRERE